MQKWEYLYARVSDCPVEERDAKGRKLRRLKRLANPSDRRGYMDIDQFLATMGDEGWEMFSVVATNIGDQEREEKLYFKRPKA